MINVLWVDDLIKNQDGSNTDMCNSVINSAYDEGINITPFATYEEAFTELEKFPSKWIAIILDVRNDNAIEGSENQEYLVMRRRIESFREKNGNSVEPFIFVFSADPATISDAKRYFIKDADVQTKEVYIKPQDTETLFSDIKKVANYSPIYAVYNKHERVMNAIEDMGWSIDDKSSVIKLINAIENKNDNTNDALFNDFRKLLESALYDKLFKSGIMDGFEKNNPKSSSDKDTINNRSNYIGKNADVPVYIQRAFHSLTQVSQNGSHYNGSDKHLIVAKDTRQGNAPYLLKSCLYDLLTIICWESRL